MIYKLGHLSDLDDIEISDKALYERIREHVTILDTEYGIDRDVDEDDGGYILYCERGTSQLELLGWYDYEQDMCDYTQEIAGTEYCYSTFILNNEYVVIIMLSINDAPKELLDAMIGGQNDN